MDYKAFLSDLFPFRGVNEESFEKIVASLDYTVRRFEKGETVYSDAAQTREIGFVIEGECRIVKERAEADAVYLNTMRSGSSFGILSVLNPDDEFPTAVVAAKACRVLFIPADAFIGIVKKYPTVAMNVISFLAQKINFLNKKVGTFSAKSVKEKVAEFILEKSREFNSFSFSATKLAALLNTGRASIYRALEALCESGCILVEEKTIKILDKTKLKGEI